MLFPGEGGEGLVGGVKKGKGGSVELVGAGLFEGVEELLFELHGGGGQAMRVRAAFWKVRLGAAAE